MFNLTCMSNIFSNDFKLHIKVSVILSYILCHVHSYAFTDIQKIKAYFIALFRICLGVKYMDSLGYHVSIIKLQLHDHFVSLSCVIYLWPQSKRTSLIFIGSMFPAIAP